MNGADARRSERQRITAVVPVVNATTHRALGVTRDLSTGGMLLATAAPLVADALYQVEIELGGPGGAGRAIEAGMQVVSQREDGDQVLVGMRFMHLRPDDAALRGEWLAAVARRAR